MNLLSLSQRLALECSVTGTLTTAQNVTGEQQRVVTWVQQAWNDVQTAHDDWNWMRSSNVLGGGVSFPTIAGQAIYPLGTSIGQIGLLEANFAQWDKETFRCYSTATGVINEIILDPIDFDVWRDVYYLGANRNVQTRPVAIAFATDESICLGPPSNGLYTITGGYFRAPTTMAADIDTPTGLPVNFHMLIVFKAMMMYAGYEAASEVYQRGQSGWDEMMPRLEALKMEEIAFAGALA